MAEEKIESGIKFAGVFVTKINFEVFPIRIEKLNIDLDFNVANNFGPEPLQLQTVLTLKINHKLKETETTFKLEVSVVGLFEEMPGSPLKIQEFANIQAPALLFPYLRETVTSITAKSLVGPFILPPINVPALIKQANELKPEPASK